MARTVRLPALIFLACLPLCAQAPSEILRDHYREIAVAKFDASQDADISDARLETLRGMVVQSLLASKKVGDVFPAEKTPPHPDDPQLRLSGTVLKFRAGNQAERFFIGFGTGSTEIYAHISLSDSATGHVFETEEIRGLIATGYAPSSEADHMLATRIATATQMMLEKAVPKPGEALEVTDGGASAPAEQYSLPINSDNLTKAEEQIKAEAQLGFRIVGAEVVGRKDAVIKFEQTRMPSDPYEYRLFHARLPGTMKKEMDAAGADGFRLRPHTLMPNFAGILSWIMEKPPGPQDSRFEYRVHDTLRVSGAEHNVDQDRKIGYEFADTAEIPAGHIVIVEKVLPAAASK